MASPPLEEEEKPVTLDPSERDPESTVDNS